MADYGAMILMDNGNPFVTPQSTPFCLYGKYTFNSSPNGSSQQVTQYLFCTRRLSGNGVYQNY